MKAEVELDLGKFQGDVKKLQKLLINLDPAMKKAEKGFNALEKQSEKAGKQIGFFGKQVQGLRNLTQSTFGRLLTGYGLFRFTKSIIQASSTLTELDSKARVVFGDTFPMVQTRVDDIAEEVGRASSAILQFSADLGAVIEASGISGDMLAKMSTELAKLSVDLASFHNTSDEQAFNALRSAITGELEPLKRFGVVMTQANLEAHALKKGIDAKIASMNQAQLTALRYSYILDRTTTAQGDAARTAESFANQSRRLEGELRELNEELGREATGFLASGLSVINDFLRNTFIPAIKLVVQEWKAMAELIGNTSYGKFVSSNFNKIFGGNTRTQDGYKVKDYTMPGYGNLARKPGPAPFDPLANFDSLGGGPTKNGGGAAAKEAEKAAKAALAFEKDRAHVMKIQLQIKKDTVGLTKQEERAYERLSTLVDETFDVREAENFEEMLKAMDKHTDNLIKDFEKAGAAIERAKDELRELKEASAERYDDLGVDLENFNEKSKEEQTKLLDDYAEKIVRAYKEARDRIASGGGTGEDFLTVSNFRLLEGQDSDLKRAVQRILGEINKFEEGNILTQLEARFEAAEEERKKREEEKRKELEFSMELEKAYQEDRLSEFLEKNREALTAEQELQAERMISKQQAIEAELALQQDVQADITAALTTQIPIRDQAQAAYTAREVARANQVRAAWLAAAAAARRARGRAAGGIVTGPGGPTDDRIPAWLSNGEYVVKASAVKHFGKGFLDAINTMSLGKYAKGGAVSYDHRNQSRSVTVNNYGDAARVGADPAMLRWHGRKAI